MDQKPSRPRKSRAKRTTATKEVQPPLSAEDKKLFEEKEAMTMKYAPRMKVGGPKISAPGKKVTTVGLGNLTVETINGNTNV